MRLNKELAKRILGNVEGGKEFFCNGGKVFYSLRDLAEGLRNMNNNAFSYHTGEGRNDFSNWIRESFGDVRLADGIIGLDREETFGKIESRIVYIEKYLEKVL